MAPQYPRRKFNLHEKSCLARRPPASPFPSAWPSLQLHFSHTVSTLGTVPPLHMLFPLLRMPFPCHPPENCSPPGTQGNWLDLLSARPGTRGCSWVMHTRLWAGPSLLVVSVCPSPALQGGCVSLNFRKRSGSSWDEEVTEPGSEPGSAPSPLAPCNARDPRGLSPRSCLGGGHRAPRRRPGGRGSERSSDSAGPPSALREASSRGSSPEPPAPRVSLVRGTEGPRFGTSTRRVWQKLKLLPPHVLCPGGDGEGVSEGRGRGAPKGVGSLPPITLITHSRTQRGVAAKGSLVLLKMGCRAA